MYNILLVLSLIGVQPQCCRKLLMAAADATLWVDYSTNRFILEHGLPMRILGHQPSIPVLTAINLGEVGINTFAPKKYKPWINVATIVFHIPYLYNQAHKRVGYADYPSGKVPIHIGVRLWW